MRNERTLTFLIRLTAAAAVVLMLVLQHALSPSIALGIAVYMLIFSEVNLGLAKQGVDVFQLLRIRKTLREQPRRIYYPVMTGILAMLITYVVAAAA